MGQKVTIKIKRNNNARGVKVAKVRIKRKKKRGA